MLKKSFALMMTLILVLGLGSAMAAKREVKIKEPDVLDFVTTEKIVTSGDFDFDLVFEKMHESFAFHDAEHKGTNMFRVIDSEKTCKMSGQSGYVYEITYTAIDYHGKVMIKKFYVQF